MNFNIAIPVKIAIKNLKESKIEKNIYQSEKLKVRLKELNKLYDRGLITQEYYNLLKHYLMRFYCFASMPYFLSVAFYSCQRWIGETFLFIPNEIFVHTLHILILVFI